RVDIVTAFSPAYDHRILEAIGAQRSGVSRWAFGGAAVGVIVGLAFTIWTVQQWPALVLGGKPQVALPSFLIIAFELTILFATCAAFTGFLLGGRAARRIAGVAYNPSLSDRRFGLLLACRSDDAPTVGALMERSGAATWRVV